MKARASAQPRLLASANDRQLVESQSQKPLKRPARKVVFNACENCRVRKTKVPTETFVVNYAQAANNNPSVAVRRLAHTARRTRSTASSPVERTNGQGERI